MEKHYFASIATATILYVRLEYEIRVIYLVFDFGNEIDSDVFVCLLHFFLLII